MLFDAHVASTERLQRVHAWATDEASRVQAKGFALPPLSLTVVPAYGWNGVTVIHEEARYTILIVAWAFPSEVDVRRVVSHEIGHVLFDVYNVPQREEDVEFFARCVASPQVFDEHRRTNAERCSEIFARLRY